MWAKIYVLSNQIYKLVKIVRQIDNRSCESKLTASYVLLLLV